MVGSVVRPSLLRGPTVRHYAAAAAAQASATAAPELKVLNNKVTVATCDSHSPIAQVSIVFRAGSRNETYDTQGTAHYLRICAGLSTCNASAFAITRNIQQLGGNLVTTQDRETIAYTLQITRNNLVGALNYLESAATRQVFKPWEINDELPRVKYELATLPDATVLIDLLHKAAFRNSGLGNSLFCPPHQVGKIGSETLQHFVNSWCTAPRCAVVGTGVALSELAALGSNLSIGSSGNANEKAKYYGGEIRSESNACLTHVALAVEGVSLSDKDALACAVLQRASGCEPRVKWGSTTSPLNKHVANVAAAEPFGVSTFNASYTDSGLFGIVLCSPPHVAGSLTKAAAKWLKSLNVLESDVARGKSILKTEILDAADNSVCLLESMQQQAVLKGQITSPIALVNAIDKVSVADVKAIADELSKGHLSMAAMGNLKTIPYVDELE